MGRIHFLFVVTTLLTLGMSDCLGASGSCTQNRVDGTSIPTTTFTISPAKSVTPYYQWNNNLGYCGEVSLIQAGMNQGQWMSQYQARLLCGSGLSQSGPEGGCARHKSRPNFNAQLLLEPRGKGTSGRRAFSSAQVCLSNARLVSTAYPSLSGYKRPNVGLSGFQDYMTWIKAEVIAGHQVTMGVLMADGDDPQYDHIVTVTGIGTNHSVSDASYYGDDVLLFDDHGLYSLQGNQAGTNPAIPLGAGEDAMGCTPYVFGYTFDSLGATRKTANARDAQAYSILIPGVTPTYTLAGGDGYKTVTRITGHNYAFSVSAAIDHSAGGPFLVPIRLSIPEATVTNGIPNPRDPKAGWQYENAMIGQSETGEGCTNIPPAFPMSPLPLQVDLFGLTPGVSYNLYEYDLPGLTETGPAALGVPTENFNANASRASRVIHLTAKTSTYTTSVSRRSDQIIVFRAVPASAP